MSHIVGTIQARHADVIGPGATIFNPPPSPQPGGTKLLMLHFQNLNFLAGRPAPRKPGLRRGHLHRRRRTDFWTRPVNFYLFPAGVQITYVAGGATTGSVQLDQYGRGERHVGSPDTPASRIAIPSIPAPTRSPPTIPSGSAHPAELGKRDRATPRRYTGATPAASA